MKNYSVHVYNTRDNFHDAYMVRANDPVDARGVAVQRLIDETGGRFGRLGNYRCI